MFSEISRDLWILALPKETQMALGSGTFPDDLYGHPYWYSPDFACEGRIRKSSFVSILDICFHCRAIRSLYGAYEGYLCMQTRERRAWERQLTGEGMLPSKIGMRASIVRFGLF